MLQTYNKILKKFEHHDEKISIYQNDKIILDYDVLENFYHNTIIPRINMSYLMTCEKIRIFNMIKNSHCPQKESILSLFDLNKLINEQQYYGELINDIAVMMNNDVNISLINKKIAAFDPKIECYYICKLNNDPTNPFTLMEMNGFINCKNKSFRLYPESKIDIDVNYVTCESLKNMLKPQKPMQKNFIHIKNSKLKNEIIIYFDIIQPKNDLSILIRNKPNHVRIITSIIKSRQDTNFQILPDNINSWLNKSHISTTKMSHEDFDLLQFEGKENYKYSDCTTNRFILEYIFNQLIVNDVNNIIRPEMKNSFFKLAYRMSS